MKLEIMINILNYHHINFEFLESMLIIYYHILNMYYLLKRKMILCYLYLKINFSEDMFGFVISSVLYRIDTIYKEGL